MNSLEEAIATATEPGQPLDKAALQAVDEGALHIQQQRLAACPGSLVRSSTAMRRTLCGRRVEQRLHREGAIEANDQHPGLAILLVEPIHRRAGGGRPEPISTMTSVASGAPWYSTSR